MKKMKRPTMRFLILVVVCFHLIASSNCFKVVDAIGMYSFFFLVLVFYYQVKRAKNYTFDINYAHLKL